MSEKGVEVFRVISFDPTKTYQFAFYTFRQGVWPNEKYFTTEPLKFLGNYIRSERWGGTGDGSSGAEIFNDNGVINRVVYDYEGRTCFREVDLQE